MKSIIDRHAAAGITYQGFYSDEMHIQFDWDLGVHFGLNEITTRYLTPNMAKKFAARYGKEYEDFGKYLVYFSYHQHEFLPGTEAELPSQHVLGRDARGVHSTWLLRKRYFELLNETVVQLCVDTKTYAEQLFGNQIDCYGHATWEESPALDRNYPAARFSEIYDEAYSRYDCHPDDCFSSSIIEAMAGCYNYFNWNDYFTGGGTDHGEDGCSDRNYYTQALGASLAELNPFHTSYAAGWGSPQEIMRRFGDVGMSYGFANRRGDGGERIVQGFGFRHTDILALYPLDLVYAEERFGSWMVQYGYCNYITEDKLLAYGAVENDSLRVKACRYRTLVVFYSPFVRRETLTLIGDFLRAGGKVLWMATPAVMETAAETIPGAWAELFGVAPEADVMHPVTAAGRQIVFAQETGIAPMPVLTDMLPDHIYPFRAVDARVIATLDGRRRGGAV